MITAQRPVSGSRLKNGDEAGQSRCRGDSAFRPILALTLVALCAFLWFVSRQAALTAPFTGFEDVGFPGYLAYYTARHLSFGILPHLDLTNNWLLYPYGTTHVFLPWSIERELIGAAWVGLFGPGPAPQLYFLLSRALVLIGTFALLRRDAGPSVALLAGLGLTVGNFALVVQYPLHLILATSHWVELGVIANTIFLKRLANREPIGFGLMTSQILLPIAALGHELGYYAGVALTSTGLTLCLTGLLIARRYRGGSGVPAVAREVLSSARQSPARSAAIVLAGIAVAWLYVPLAFGFYKAAVGFHFEPGSAGFTTASPWRLIVSPVFVLFRRAQADHFFSTLLDRPQFLSGSPGLALLLAAGIGVVVARPALFVALPLSLFLLFSTFDPVHRSGLAQLPFFAHARLQDHFTKFYPVFLWLLALSPILAGVRRRAQSWWRLGAIGLLAIWSGEVLAGYGLIANRAPLTYVMTKQQRAFFEVVKHSPGEAVFEWPFMITGANRVGALRLGRFYGRLANSFSYQQFHEKKVVSYYVGRLHPTQIAPYLDAGWDFLFAADSTNVLSTSSRQRRDMLPAEWSFMRDFLRAWDFCGLILYTDLVPGRTRARFVDAFGEPAASTILPWMGRLEFFPVPRSNSSHSGVRIAEPVLDVRGRLAVREGTMLDLSSLDTDYFLPSGWGGAEKLGRWTDGRRAEIRFHLRAPASAVRIAIRARTLGRQRALFRLDGLLLSYRQFEGQDLEDVELPLPSRLLNSSRMHRLQIELPDCRSPLEMGQSSDYRQLGLFVERVAFLPAHGETAAPQH